ncbi:hypothetical protein ACF3M1_08235 [Luteimonas sp. WGS1318]|uniref:hypothetical protein n=1 Tax=Luteimonas sp. WGS1318 TaxID=3366815 RepID=UPI00372D1D5C
MTYPLESNMTPAALPAEIVAIAYGDVEVASGAVLMEVWVREITAEGTAVIGARDPVLVHYGMLEDLIARESRLITAMRKNGATRDVLPPAGRTLPAWDAGPALPSLMAFGYMCDGLGYRDVEADLGAVRLWFSVRPLAQAGNTDQEHSQGGEYLMARHTLPAFHQGMRNVLRKMRELGARPPEKLN